MIIQTEKQMITLGTQLAKTLTPPTTIELTGDIGAGKTTLAKGIALGLNITNPITSPSFTISKTYTTGALTLNHFDLYRLTDPGIIADTLAESIADPTTITLVEWATTVADILPPNHITIAITYNDDASRTVKITPHKELPL